MQFDPGGLADLADRVGVGGAVALIFAFGVGLRFPAVLREVKGIYEIHMRYKVEKAKIEKEAGAEKRRVLRDIEKRNR